jgi:hypothetical protein
MVGRDVRNGENAYRKAREGLPCGPSRTQRPFPRTRRECLAPADFLDGDVETIGFSDLRTCGAGRDTRLQLSATPLQQHR